MCILDWASQQVGGSGAGQLEEIGPFFVVDGWRDRREGLDLDMNRGRRAVEAEWT